MSGRRKGGSGQSGQLCRGEKAREGANCSGKPGTPPAGRAPGKKFGKKKTAGKLRRRWRIWDSNPRPIDCEPIALPTELIPRCVYYRQTAKKIKRLRRFFRFLRARRRLRRRRAFASFRGGRGIRSRRGGLRASSCV